MSSGDGEVRGTADSEVDHTETAKPAVIAHLSAVDSVLEASVSSLINGMSGGSNISLPDAVAAATTIAACPSPVAVAPDKASPFVMPFVDLPATTLPHALLTCRHFLMWTLQYVTGEDLLALSATCKGWASALASSACARLWKNECCRLWLGEPALARKTQPTWATEYRHLRATLGLPCMSANGRYVRDDLLPGSPAEPSQGAPSLYRALDREAGTELGWIELHLPDFISSVGQTTRDVDEQVHRAAELLASLVHPRLVRYHGGWTDTARNVLILLCDLPSDRTLRAFRRTMQGPMKVRLIVKWLGQLLDALAYLHGQSPPIVHNAVALHNVYVESDGAIKLAALHHSSILPHKAIAPADLLGPTKAAFEFVSRMAPEMADEEWDERADVFSLGILLLEAITGDENVRPDCTTASAVLSRLEMGDPPSALAKIQDYPPPLLDFIEQCLLPVHLRPSVVQLQRHPLLVAQPASGTARTASAPVASSSTIVTPTAVTAGPASTSSSVTASPVGGTAAGAVGVPSRPTSPLARAMSGDRTPHASPRHGTATPGPTASTTPPPATPSLLIDDMEIGITIDGQGVGTLDPELIARRGVRLREEEVDDEWSGETSESGSGSRIASAGTRRRVVSHSRSSSTSLTMSPTKRQPATHAGPSHRRVPSGQAATLHVVLKIELPDAGKVQVIEFDYDTGRDSVETVALEMVSALKLPPECVGAIEANLQSHLDAAERERETGSEGGGVLSDDGDDDVGVDSHDDVVADDDGASSEVEGGDVSDVGGDVSEGADAGSGRQRTRSVSRERERDGKVKRGKKGKDERKKGKDKDKDKEKRKDKVAVAKKKKKRAKRKGDGDREEGEASEGAVEKGGGAGKSGKGSRKHRTRKNTKKDKERERERERDSERSDSELSSYTYDTEGEPSQSGS